MYGPRFRCSSEFRDARVRRALPLSLASPVFSCPPNGYGIGGGVFVSVPVCMSTVYNRSKPTPVNASESRMLESGVQAAGIALIRNRFNNDGSAKGPPEMEVFMRTLCAIAVVTSAVLLGAQGRPQIMIEW